MLLLAIIPSSKIYQNMSKPAHDSHRKLTLQYSCVRWKSRPHNSAFTLVYDG